MSQPVEARAFAPASVGNIGVGFDLLGHTVTGIGDIAHVRRIESPEVRIASIDGELSSVCQIPLEAARNTAGQALIALRAQTGIGFGFELRLEKGIPLGSGLGGSAASCVAALVAANALLPEPLARDALYACALEGEFVASGSRQGDNVAPMLLGGVVMCTPTQILPLPAPDWLHAAVVHPEQILETRRARAVLAEPYPLSQVVQHCGHLALFLTGLAQSKRELIAAGLKDILVEPRRAPLIPGFAEVKAAALEHDALGASISGAGPSVFAWFDDAGRAHQATAAMQAAFAAAGFDSQAYVGPVNGPHAELLG
ncbi:homoserine kinase [Lysobacteraceae bacterium NML95-0200]|nr:homoserine kinase [Xanthomonadaceae bacterium NML95-0200]